MCLLKLLLIVDAPICKSAFLTTLWLFFEPNLSKYHSFSSLMQLTAVSWEKLHRTPCYSWDCHFLARNPNSGFLLQSCSLTLDDFKIIKKLACNMAKQKNLKILLTMVVPFISTSLFFERCLIVHCSLTLWIEENCSPLDNSQWSLNNDEKVSDSDLLSVVLVLVVICWSVILRKKCRTVIFCRLFLF